MVMLTMGMVESKRGIEDVGGGGGNCMRTD